METSAVPLGMAVRDYIVSVTALTAIKRTVSANLSILVHELVVKLFYLPKRSQQSNKKTKSIYW